MIAVGGDHDIDPDQTAGIAAGLADLVPQGPDVGGLGIGFIIGFDHADAVGGDDAYSALPGDGGGQIGQRDADSHSALDDRYGRPLVSYPELGQGISRNAGFLERGELGFQCC